MMACFVLEWPPQLCLCLMDIYVQASIDNLDQVFINVKDKVFIEYSKMAYTNKGRVSMG